MTETGIRNKLCYIKYINCNERGGQYVVIIAGLIISLWTNTILTIACFPGYMREREQIHLIIKSSQITHALVIIGASLALVKASQEKNRNNFKPWMIIKVLELVALLVASILVATNRQYSGLTYVGIIFLILGLYVTMCVWKAYRLMPENLNNVSVDPPIAEQNSPNLLPPEHPPSYEEYNNHIRI